MTKHTCVRCGHELRCQHGSWPDRRPYAAALFAVPVTITGLGAIAAYPWLFVPLLMLAGVAYVADREHRRRAALAARADWEHREIMVAALNGPAFPRHQTPQRRLADHCSITEPIRRIA